MVHDEIAVIQNLQAAGCNTEEISAFIKNLREENMAEGFRMLAVYRRSLLNNLHQKQKQIDCLDYLVYQLKKHQ